jgi:2-polyprenyl-3-methyl-5-hydroxy-6-metoxy-1,4-benzoquinol methylase
MGYRNLHIFGMDSSHKDGKSHAKHQSINDGDPCAVVRYNGKEYLCSITMKLQAERFQETSKALMDAGAKITVHGEGLLPEMWRNPQDMSEEDKYTLMWSQPEYRHSSPGDRVVGSFLEMFKPNGKVIDFGCGSGKAGVKIDAYGCDVLLLDFAENSRDENARHLPFAKQDLTKPIPYIAKYGFCTDVMEHIPTDDVETVINNIMDAAENVFFQISTVSDCMGVIIGQELHLTVRPHSWWKELFIKNGYVVQWEEEQNIAALFFVVRPHGNP